MLPLFSPLAVATVNTPVGEGSWALLIIYFVLAIGVSFFCSVFEAVLLSVTRPYIAGLKQSRPQVGAVLEDLKSRIDRPLTSILTLNTIAHTMGAMGVAGQVAALSGGGLWETVSSALMTLAVLIASEIIPKNLGARNWKAWAPWVGKALSGLCWIMTPVVYLIGLFSRGGHHGDGFSRDELRVMAELGRREGKLLESESRILENLLHLREVTIDAIKTPRTVMFSLDETSTVGDYVEHHSDRLFSRIPVYGKGGEDITGFVLLDEVLLHAARDEYDVPLSRLKRRTVGLSEHTRVPEAFNALIASRHHLAVVYDEFGGVGGLVTLEDVVETLLGLEIVDENDAKEDMQAHARRLWEERRESLKRKTPAS